MNEVRFGIWLKQRRKNLDLTQDDLAQHVGYSRETIRKIEADKLRPSKQLADRLAQHLKVAPDEYAAFIRFARTGQCASSCASFAEEAPPIAEQAAHRYLSNLPIPSTPLIGRDHDLLEVRNRLACSTVRLMTLTGAPGIGKTFLALSVAAELTKDFEDGVFFVDLAVTHDPSLVSAEIAQTLGLREIGGQPLQASLRNYLRDKHILLVLDNFEHVLEAGLLVVDLLAACPQLKLLVTSRIPLHLSGEYEFAVPTLALPEIQHLPQVALLTHYGAVDLFVQRVQAHNAKFTLTEANAAAISEICIRLEGLPLAIELAAARCKLFSPQALVARLCSRLTLLVDGARDLPARHQTLRAAIAWSYDLLNVEEQMLFRRLSVFVNGCTLAAAEAICTATGDLAIPVLEGLASLVNKNLLRQTVEVDGEPRFSMLETICEYGRACLIDHGEFSSLQQQHAQYYLLLAEKAETHLRGPQQQTWLERLEVEHGNLRAVLEWSWTDHGANEIGLRLVGALWWFWHRRGYISEGRRWIARALESTTSGVPTRAWAKALQGMGELARLQGDYITARTRLEEGLAVGRALEDKHSCAYSLSYLAYLGIIADEWNDIVLVRSLAEESLALFRELGDAWGVAFALNTLGLVAHVQGSAEEGVWLEESLAHFRTVGDTWGIGLTLNHLGEVARSQSNYGRAGALYEESLVRFQEIGDKELIAIVLHNLGYVAQHRGKARCAVSHFVNSLTLNQELGDMRGVAYCLVGLAGVAGMVGQPCWAARVYGAAEALREAIGARLDPADEVEYSRALAAVRDQLSDTAFSAAWREGYDLPLAQIIADALNWRPQLDPESESPAEAKVVG